MHNLFIFKAFNNNFQSSRILLKNCKRLLLLPFLVLTLTKPVYSQSEAFRVKSPTSGSLFYVQSDGSVAVDTSTTLGSLTVNGINGIIATGTFGNGTALNLGAGTRMMWYPKSAAFRVGYVNGTQWDDANIGSYSLATGSSTTASGDFSTAMGEGTTASGVYSTAMGEGTTASGSSSTAMGSFASTNSHRGSFVYGDISTNITVSSTADYQFMVRAAGGYVFYSNSAMSIGAELDSSQSAWSVISDSTKKENFLPVNGEEVLNKISKFNLRSWNYKGQNPKVFRHYGPMAQEFFNAFGQDKLGTIGNDTTINSADFAGINLIAIQALEKRTDKLQKELNEKDKELTAVRANNSQLNRDVAGIKNTDSRLQEELAGSLEVNQNLNEKLQQIENTLSKLTSIKVAALQK